MNSITQQHKKIVYADHGSDQRMSSVNREDVNENDNMLYQMDSVNVGATQDDYTESLHHKIS